MDTRTTQVVSSAVAFVALFNVMDFIINTFVTGSGYTFSPVIDLLVPLALAVVFNMLAGTQQRHR